MNFNRDISDYIQSQNLSQNQRTNPRQEMIIKIKFPQKEYPISTKYLIKLRLRKISNHHKHTKKIVRR